MTGLTVVIQAGGQSTRMGRDKGLVMFDGVRLVEYILNQVRGFGDDTILITNEPKGYVDLGLPIYEDVVRDKGALGGLYSAIDRSPQEWCLVLACDMPFVRLPLLQYMVGISGKYDAVVPKPGEPPQFEPFRALYRKTCLSAIDDALNRGRKRVISFFDGVRCRIVEQAEIHPFDPDGHSFFNINTRDDLAEAESIAMCGSGRTDSDVLEM